MNDLKQYRWAEFRAGVSENFIALHKIRILSLTRVEGDLPEHDLGNVFNFTGVDTNGWQWSGTYNLRTCAGSMSTSHIAE